MPEQTNRPPEFETSSEAMNWLLGQGYTQDFNMDVDCIIFDDRHEKLYPNEFEIDFTFRFEGMTDPADESVVYAIASLDNKMKGMLVSAYGAYSESLSEEMIAKLAMRS